MTNHKITPRQLWLLYAVAATTFIFSLFYIYVGEEGVYTITSIEMWKNHDFFLTTQYGANYGRPPLYNWLIIPIANVLGWAHMLIAARIVTMCATITTGITLAWLAKRLTGDSLFAALAALIFFSYDTLFYRGWLAYSDPLFALAIFSALAFLWVGLHAKKSFLIWFAVFFVTCAALAKVQTAYVFYIVALGILFLNVKYRKVALSLNSLLAHIAGIIFFVCWYFLITKGLQAGAAGNEILIKLRSLNFHQYLKQLCLFPLETILRFLPASGIVLYLWIRKRIPSNLSNKWDASSLFSWNGKSNKHWLFYAVMIAVVNWLPYWLCPNTSARYLMPIYPFFALIITYFIFQAGETAVLLMVKWFIALIVLKLIFAVLIFPYYQNHYRGHYVDVARDVLTTTQEVPLYIADVSATGLAVAANIDSLIYPKPPLTTPPAKFDSGFVLSYTNESKFGCLIKRYKLGGNNLYLFYKIIRAGSKSR